MLRQNYELYILKRRNGKLSVDLLHSSAFSNAFKIRLLQKMHNPADHIFPPQWLVKAFQILIAQSPHDTHRNSSAKGSFNLLLNRISNHPAPAIGGEL